jgi:hypothetical protein
VQEPLLDAVRQACAGAPGLQAAVVFGSALVRTTPHDLDLALLWDPALPVTERWRRGNAIAAEIEHHIAPSGIGVDLKDLRELPLALKFRVLRDGRRVVVADPRAMVRFQSETVPLALDFLSFQRRALAAAARRLAHG